MTVTIHEATVLQCIIEKEVSICNGQDEVSHFSMGVYLCRLAIPKPRKATGCTKGKKKTVK